MDVDCPVPHLENDDTGLSSAGLEVRFDFDRKGAVGLNDGEASGGQQVMKSLILLIALLMDDARPGGFVFIDEPFATSTSPTSTGSAASCAPPAPST